MAVRRTVDIPEALHDRLRRRAESTGTSIRALVVRALEETYPRPKCKYVTGLLINTKGKRLGPRFPTRQNPWDIIFP